MEQINRSFFESLVIPRPVGSENNVKLERRLARLGEQLGYTVEELPFDCFSWQVGAASCLETAGTRIPIFPSPFSAPVTGCADFIFIDTIDRLRTSQITDKIVVLHGEIAAEPLMPKNFPYCDVPEHREIAEQLESGRPLSVLSAMGKHPMCGIDPCPMFEDCYFTVPSACFPLSQLELIRREAKGRICIDSAASPAFGKQLILHKAAKEAGTGSVIICAHMDTAYGTSGALDNASGLYAMLKLMEAVSSRVSRYHLRFIPFNGEDYSDVSGQRAYFERYPLESDDLRLVINLDGIGLSGSKNALSLYNLPDVWTRAVHTAVAGCPTVENGEPWYAGDHSMFAAPGVPALAAVSSDLDTLTAISHTQQDTMNRVDLDAVQDVVEVIVRILDELHILKS